MFKKIKEFINRHRNCYMVVYLDGYFCTSFKLKRSEARAWARRLMLLYPHNNGIATVYPYKKDSSIKPDELESFHWLALPQPEK